jgi:hypothetical protein
MKTLKRTFISFFLCSVILSCSKQEVVEVDNETQSVIDHAIVEQEYLAMAQAVYHHAVNTPATGAPQSNQTACDTLHRLSGDTVSGALFELVIATACNASFPDGKSRYGRLLVKQNGSLRVAGSRLRITALAYSAGDVGYGCDSLVLTSIAADPSQARFRMQLFSGAATVSYNYPDMKSVRGYNTDMTLSVYPRGLPEGSDPICLIWGSGSGYNRNGRKFSVAIPETTPLGKRRGCRFISEGGMTLTPEGFKAREIRYGEGVCDDAAAYSVSGNTVGLKLK